MISTKRKFVKTGLLGASAVVALLASSAFGPVLAASDKPIRIILPGSPGSGVSLIMRAASSALSTALGSPVVVEDIPGAGGVVGTSAITRAQPDGLTLGVISSNHAIIPSVYKTLPFDPIADITPIAVVGSTPIVMAVNPEKLPAKNAQELIALLKAKPGEYRYASAGTGSILHLAGEAFLDEAGAKAVHVPYRGAGPMVTDLVGGQVEFAPAALPTVQQYAANGSLRIIGVTGPSRLSFAPDIPTMAEQGMPGYIIETWFAVVGPAKLPPADVKRIHDAFAAAFSTPEVREAMTKQGNSINVSTPEYAASFIKSEIEKFSKLVKKAGIEPQ